MMTAAVVFLVIACLLGIKVYSFHLHRKMSHRIASLSDDGSAPSLLWMPIRSPWGKLQRMIDKDPELKKYDNRISLLMSLFLVTMFAGFIALYIVKVHRWPWG